MHSMSPASGKRSVALLGAIFTWAIKRKMVVVNPCHGIEKPADAVKTRRLSVDEYAQLGSALHGDNVAKDIFLFLAVSGWRSSEARLLKFSELDLDRRVASLSDTKSGQSIRPLNKIAIEIILTEPRTSHYVFGLQNGAPLNKLDYHWSRLLMPKDVTAHTMRHSIASLAGDMGLPDHTISKLLGHRQNSITSRYIHIEKSVIEAADKVAEETLRLMRA